MAATSRTLIPVKGSDAPLVDAFVVGEVAVELEEIEDESHRLEEPEAVEHAPPYADVAGDAASATGATASESAQTSATIAVLAIFIRYPSKFTRSARLDSDVAASVPSPPPVSERLGSHP
jgi:hypothetical protein